MVRSEAGADFKSVPAFSIGRIDNAETNDIAENGVNAKHAKAKAKGKIPHQIALIRRASYAATSSPINRAQRRQHTQMMVIRGGSRVADVLSPRKNSKRDVGPQSK